MTFQPGDKFKMVEPSPHAGKEGTVISGPWWKVQFPESKSTVMQERMQPVDVIVPGPSVVVDPVVVPPATNDPTADPGAEREGYRLVFQDEFDYDGEPTTHKWLQDWTTPNNWPWTDFSKRVGGAVVGDGKLRVHTLKTRTPSGRAYSGVMMTTRNKFTWQQRGMVEVRAKMPQIGKAVFPCPLWTQPYGHYQPEIDVMEWTGSPRPRRAYLTYHRLNAAKAPYHYDMPDTLDKAFHRYAVRWEPGLIAWDIDGVQRAKETNGISSAACYLLIQASIGSKVWGEVGAPDATTPDSAFMEIDYVRAYQRA